MLYKVANEDVSGSIEVSVTNLRTLRAIEHLVATQLCVHEPTLRASLAGICLLMGKLTLIEKIGESHTSLQRMTEQCRCCLAAV